MPEEAARRGVILMAHGAPERVADVPAFLMNLRDGRPLPAAAVAEITERYRRISVRDGADHPGELSPLARLTEQQARALRQRLRVPVYVGMRNWRPYIAGAVRQATEDGVDQLTALCMAPQNSRTSVGLYREALDHARETMAPGLEVRFIESWHDDPLLIAAFRERILGELDQIESEAKAGHHRPNSAGMIPVIFTAHSVPERTIREGDPYERQVRETARLVAESLGGRLTEWSVAFQSQGMRSEPWIGPTVESEIDRLAAAGHARVLVAPVGFVCDHVEILYDIDVLFREYGRARGVTISRTESLNDSPLFIEALADLVNSHQSAETVAPDLRLPVAD